MKNLLSKNAISMKIKQYDSSDKAELIKLISQYRIILGKLKGSERKTNLKAAEVELEFYQKKKYPIFIAKGRKGNLIGYHVCKVEDGIIWSESLYIIPEERRKGIGSALYEKAELIAKEIGCDTVYNWVHPNNFKSINFLKKRGYNVLNLIEVCRKRPGENLTQKIKVGTFEFDY